MESDTDVYNANLGL